MKLLRLEIRNFKPFKQLSLPDDDQELPGGLILIRGPNSTGKSSLLEAVLWGLWGPDAIELANDEIVSFTSTHCTVIMEFRVAGSEYKIHREYNSADGLSVVLFARRGDAWKRIADKTMSVKSKIDEILSLDYKQALQTLLVRQGEVSVIANATPVILRKLLEDIYDIGLLRQMESHLENMEKDIGLKVDALNRDFERPESIRQQIEQHEGRIREHEEKISNLTAELESAEKLVTSMPNSSTIEGIAEAESDLEDAERDVRRIEDDLKNDLAKAGFLDADDELIDARLESLRKVQERAESDRAETNGRIRTASQDIGRFDGISQDLKDKVDHLKMAHSDKGEEMLCPTCSKPLSPEERDGLVAEYELTIKQNAAKTAQLKKQLKGHQQELDLIEKKTKQASTSEQATAQVKETNQKIRAAREQLETAKRTMEQVLSEAGADSLESLLQRYSSKNVAEVQTKLALLQSTLANLKKDLEEAHTLLKREQELLRNLEGKEELMRRMENDIQELARLDTHTKYVRRKLVSGFVADYVFQKRLIGIIKAATNQYVRFFTSGQYTAVDLEPTGAKGRSGSGLLLRIWDERDQAWKKASQLSFGDRTAISLGLRLGISRTMSSIRPLKDSPARMPMIRCVLLDEPLGGLDKTRRESVVARLTSDQSFEQIFLITHTDVQGWEGVPVIEVSKEGASSDAALLT